MYTVMFHTDGYYTKEIKGYSKRDYLQKFENTIFEADFGELEDIEWDINDTTIDTTHDICSIYIEGRYKVAVINYDGTDINTIKALAVDGWSEADFGELDDCEERVIWIEDENGRRIYQDI